MPSAKLPQPPVKVKAGSNAQTNESIKIDYEQSVVIVGTGDASRTLPLGSQDAFQEITKAWLRSGWDAKYVYSFTWMGRPIIQLPDDVMRIQEVIYRVKPDVIIETGIAHGGSLIFYASLCKAMGKGRVIGIDIDIRAHNRKAIEEHEMFSYLNLIEGDSASPDTVAQVDKSVGPGEVGIVFLDARHTKEHVEAELEAYAKFVGIGSYIVAMDGIMKDLAGAPRSNPDWTWNNPEEAAKAFVKRHRNFVIEEPGIPFNEGAITERVTYWPNAFIKRVK